MTNVGTPTEVQAQAWPVIAAGQHVLVSAPTGSGKTLTAFLWALDRLITGEWESGQGIRALYISPLKALNNDINRNLAGPLSELRYVFERAGESFPAIRVMTRSGDTPANERARMLRRPPEILITTPESLNILLTSRRGRALFDPGSVEVSTGDERSSSGGLRTVILDEIHAVAGGRRGTHLITAVERLAELAGEFQRIALSATVRPLAEVAHFVGGYELHRDNGEYDFRQRAVRIIEAQMSKRIEIEVRAPARNETMRTASAAGTIGLESESVDGEISDRANLDDDSQDVDGQNIDSQDDRDSVWTAMAREFKGLIAANRSTLFFTGSRRLAEKMARLINEGEAEPLALCHHGSLSREIRLLVEERLKAGNLRAIVATSSLELGIDIGSVDQVVMIQTPREVSATLQRVGRAGHGVGQVSRGAIYPSHSRDILDAALMARAVDERAIEAVRPPVAPLDIIAQVVVSMVANQERDIEEVYARLRCAAPCHSLDPRAFALVLDMLAGRYAATRIRELRPRISIDRTYGRIRGRASAERALYLSGGTIANRGYFDLRVGETNAKIGELDEEFVFERSIGEIFGLGNNYWQIQEITHNDVIVTQARSGDEAAIVPFWRAEAEDRGGHFAERIAVFLEQVDERLTRAATAPAERELLIAEFQNEYHLDPGPAGQLFEFLARQREATGHSLPHRHHLLIEHFADPLSAGAIGLSVWP
jgi:ATP-dependent Lhr-like helicase